MESSKEHSSTLFASTQSQVDDLKLASGGKLAVATSHLTGTIWSGEVLVYELKERKRNYLTAAGNSSVAWVGGDSEYLAAAGDDASVTLWLTSETTDNPKLYFKEHDDIVSSLASNPSKRDLFASGSWDTKVKVWLLAKDRAVSTLEGHYAPVHALDWQKNSDHLLFSASQDSTAKQWDTRQKVSVLNFVRQSPVFSIQTSPHDENTIVTGEEDAVLAIYDLRKPSQPHLVEQLHNDAIRSISFSPHSPLLACASDDTTVSVFDLASRTKVACFNQHTDFVRGVAWDVEHKNVLLSGGWDRKVFLHTLNL